MKKMLALMVAIAIIGPWPYQTPQPIEVQPTKETVSPLPKPVMLGLTTFDRQLLEKESQEAYDAEILKQERLETAKAEEERQKKRFEPPKPEPEEWVIYTFLLVEEEFDVPWQYLYAVCEVETKLGKDLGNSRPHLVMPAKQWTAFKKICLHVGKNPHDMRVSKSGDIGPMQFQPATWLEYATDADGDGIANPWSLADASASTAKYLGKYGFNKSPIGAVASYNGGNKRDEKAWAYGREVIRLAKKFE